MIGNRLKELRTDAGMNQPKFAALVGTTKQYVSQLESGRNLKPSGEYVEGWARHFAVNLRWLLSGAGPKYADRATRGPASPPLDEEIVDATHKAMEEMYEKGKRHYPKEDVARFLLVYVKLAQRKAGVSEAELLGAGLTDTVISLGASIERTVGMSGKGTDPGAVARRIRRKA